jgi:hypothetical protein
MAVVAGTNGIRPAPLPQPPAALSGQRSWMERLYGCPSIPGIPVREVEVSREQPLKFTSRNHATILSVQMTSMSIPADFQGRNVVKCLIPCGEFREVCKGSVISLCPFPLGFATLRLRAAVNINPVFQILSSGQRQAFISSLQTAQASVYQPHQWVVVVCPPPLGCLPFPVVPR